jgi:hypothetical protein
MEHGIKWPNRTGDAEQKESAAESFWISIWAPPESILGSRRAHPLPSADPANLKIHTVGSY